MNEFDFDSDEDLPACDRCGQPIGVFSVTAYCKDCLREMGGIQ